MRLACNEGLDDNIFDVVPNLLRILILAIPSMAIYIVKNCPKTPFVAHIILVWILIEYEVVAVLVDCIVSQMHAQISQVAPEGRLVNLGCEPRQPLMIDVGPQRVNPGHQHVDAEVKFELIDKVGLVKVPLRHIVFIGLQPLEVPCEENALALAAGFRLHDEGLRLLLIELIFEVLGVLGEQPGLREEGEILRTRLLYGHQVLGKEVFSS